MQVRHRMSTLVLQTLRHIGRKGVNESVIARIRRILRESDLARLPQDLRYTSDWIYEVAKRIATKLED